MTKSQRIDICLCTFRRPMVVDTLRSLDALEVPDGYTLQVIVIDNDNTPSAKNAVMDLASTMVVPLKYVHAPACNISIARNAGLDAADGDWIGFLDDDEIVPPTWLRALLSCQQSSQADAVFGHSRAIYPNDAPDWITSRDYHSQIREPRNGLILTGHTCNALLRWGDVDWRNQRFDVARGTSGGEDTDYFFRLNRLGARYSICDNADVFETVEPRRLSFHWLFQRKFRIGQSYVASTVNTGERVKLFCAAALKAVYCQVRAGAALLDTKQNRFWRLRGALHLGVCAGCLKVPTAKLYGK